MKRNIKSRVSDFCVVLFCLGGAALSLRLFWLDLNAAFSKMNEVPIATITWKYKVSQRKISDRLVWDRLQQNAPIYNGDTIRTSDSATATIEFTDTTTLKLGSNSIVQLFVDDDNLTNVDFSGGDVFIDSAESTRGMKLRSGNAAVNLDAGSSLSVAGVRQASSGGGMVSGIPFSVQLLTGSAAFTGSTDGVSQSVTAGQAFSVAADGAVQQHTITVNEPLPSARFINYSADRDSLLPVRFSWVTPPLPEKSYVILETSADKDFAQIQEQISFSGVTSVMVNLPSGVIYWRLYITDDKVKNESSEVTGKIHVLAAPTPSPIVPASGDSFSYRTRNPSVRFVWSGNEYAASYFFEVADNAAMRNPVISMRTPRTSCIVSTLGAGHWYWRITPYYSINATGYGDPSDISEFDILQSGALRPLQLLMPVANGFVNTASSDSSQTAQTSFSWKNEPEALSYILRIAKNPAFTDSLIERRTTDNWCTVIPQRDGVTNGRWYWSVLWTDTEGNLSPLSDVRTFSAVDGEIIFRQVFPPNDYRIGSSLLPDTRFTWKKNLPDAVRFQISSNSDFTSLLIDNEVAASVFSTKISTLPVGTYYWRLVSVPPKTDSESEVPAEGLATSPRSFIVDLSLEAPVPLFPPANSRVVVRPEETVVFAWNPVPDADYYHVSLYAAGSDKPVFESQTATDLELPVNVDSLPDGTYRWSIQAFASETAKSSRRSGIRTEVSFSLKKIHPVVLQYPEDGAEYDGLTAFTTPDTVSWQLRDKPLNSELLIVRDADTMPMTYEDGRAADAKLLYFRADAGAGKVELPPLPAGTYRWIVTGIQSDGIDISAVKPRIFTVLPIPPLPAPERTFPVAGTDFDASYLVQSLQAQLQWNTVPDADSYHLILYRNSEIILQKDIPSFAANDNVVQFLIEDLSVLDEGSFVWIVEARRHMENGEVLRYGIPAQNDFKITLPPMPRIELTDLGEMYGN